ncbi:p21-C-terminal region-binding protein-domain-containing protein [Mucidula mucida]|nr:p21-C-terminal region-binding protein-domain-containing protein [Mucidula mucida]
MSKRKTNQDDADSDSDVSFVDVTFDFFDLNPDIDYQGLKKLAVQLFQRDAESLNPHELVELVLSQPKMGTTIKLDDKDSDPYAILTVLNMHVHKENPFIKALAAYCLEKSKMDSAFHTTLQALFSQTEKHVGFILCERLRNMPVQVIPPMYRMLTEEMKQAVDQNEPYNFSHFLIISRTYHLTEADETFLSSTQPKPRSSKKSKKAKIPQAPSMSRPSDGIYSFHPEDDLIKQASLHFADYTFSAPAEPRNEESFGLDTRGRLMLVPSENYVPLVERMLETFAVA